MLFDSKKKKRRLRKPFELISSDSKKKAAHTSGFDSKKTTAEAILFDSVQSPIRKGRLQMLQWRKRFESKEMGNSKRIAAAMAGIESKMKATEADGLDLERKESLGAVSETISNRMQIRFEMGSSKCKLFRFEKPKSHSIRFSSQQIRFEEEVIQNCYSIRFEGNSSNIRIDSSTEDTRIRFKKGSLSSHSILRQSTSIQKHFNSKEDIRSTTDSIRKECHKEGNGFDSKWEAIRMQWIRTEELQCHLRFDSKTFTSIRRTVSFQRQTHGTKPSIPGELFPFLCPSAL